MAKPAVFTGRPGLRRPAARHPRRSSLGCGVIAYGAVVSLASVIVPVLATGRLDAAPHVRGHRASIRTSGGSLVRGGIPLMALIVFNLIYGTIDIPILGAISGDDAGRLVRRSPYRWVGIPIFIVDRRRRGLLPARSRPTARPMTAEFAAPRQPGDPHRAAWSSVPAAIGLALVADDLISAVLRPPQFEPTDRAACRSSPCRCRSPPWTPSWPSRSSPATGTTATSYVSVVAAVLNPIACVVADPLGRRPVRQRRDRGGDRHRRAPSSFIMIGRHACCGRRASSTGPTIVGAASASSPPALVMVPVVLARRRPAARAVQVLVGRRRATASASLRLRRGHDRRGPRACVHARSTSTTVGRQSPSRWSDGERCRRLRRRSARLGGDLHAQPRTTRSAPPSPACWRATTRRSTSRHRPEHDRRDARGRRADGRRRSPAALRPRRRGRAVAGLQQRHPPHGRRDPRLHRRRLHRRDRTGCRTIVDAFAAEPDGDLLYGQVVAAGHDGRRRRVDAAARDPRRPSG